MYIIKQKSVDFCFISTHKVRYPAQSAQFCDFIVLYYVLLLLCSLYRNSALTVLKELQTRFLLHPDSSGCKREADNHALAIISQLKQDYIEVRRLSHK